MMMSSSSFTSQPASQEEVATGEGSCRGLFSVPGLRQPQDFMRMAREAMEECDSRRRMLANEKTEAPSSPSEILRELDAISQAVCNVIDAAELCRSAHAQEAWREAAHRAFAELSEYIATLNSDPSLYRALSTVVSDGSKMSTLNEEERRFAILLKAEFEREGIHLQDDHTRQRLLEVRNATTDLESTFSRNLVGSGGAHKTFSAPLRSVRDVVPLPVLKHYVPSLAEDPSATARIDLPTDQALLQSLVKYSPDATLRRDAYLESVTAVPENLAVLDMLVARRTELAGLLGFGSYAEYTLVDKMAGHPSRVVQFLDRVADRNKAPYRKEMEQLLSAKRRVEGTSGSATTIEPWDVPFYVGVLKARGGFDVHAVSEYLTLERAVGGMQSLVQRSFGIEMTEVPMTADERWDVTETRGKTDNPAHRIRRFDFNEQDGSLGTMYLDLHPRPGKYGHAAHFTVRCGCLARTSSSAATGVRDDGSLDEDVYQKPIVALVCNLSASGREGNISHGEFETLFHEFGHALHSLLSRTKFQHMSGTRAAMDFVETPSHLLENFAWDPQFLGIVARHHVSDEPMPDNMVQQLVKSRNEFSAIERQNQIIYAQFDQMLFGRRDAGHKSLSTIQLFESLHRAHGVPHAPGTHWHTRFGHLVTYGAAYYGYLFSQVFAADIWKECFLENSLSREAGDRLWHRLLSHGGAKDPWLMLEDMLGRPPMSVG
jgi:mitochondrial intermediate peptidase